MNVSLVLASFVESLVVLWDRHQLGTFLARYQQGLLLVATPPT
jgi:hypothetical protein